LADLEIGALSAVCVHRWRVTTPVGEQCTGTCCLCGAKRCFTNERHPFGQPGKNRKPVPQARPAFARRSAVGVDVTPFLLLPESVLRSATLHE